MDEITLVGHLKNVLHGKHFIRVLNMWWFSVFVECGCVLPVQFMTRLLHIADRDKVLSIVRD